MVLLGELMKATELHGLLLELNADDEFVQWARGKSLAQAWEHCERPEWMLWLCEKMMNSVGWPTRQEIVLFVCACADNVLHIFEGKYPHNHLPHKAIEAARSWTKGRATLEEVKIAITDMKMLNFVGSLSLAANNAVTAAHDAAAATSPTYEGAAANAVRAAVAAEAWPNIFLRSKIRRKYANLLRRNLKAPQGQNVTPTSSQSKFDSGEVPQLTSPPSPRSSPTEFIVNSPNPQPKRSAICCTKCGIEWPAGSLFCGKCGHKMFVPQKKGADIAVASVTDHQQEPSVSNQPSDKRETTDPSQAATPPNKLSNHSELFERAKGLINQGNHREAAAVLEQMIKDMPPDWHSINEKQDSWLLGSYVEGAFWTMEEWQAFCNYQRQVGREGGVVWVELSYSQACCMLAGLQNSFGESQKALKLIDLGLELESDHPDLLCEKGFYLCKAGNFAGAYDCYVQAENIRPWAISVQKARAIRGQGAALIDLGQLCEAEKQFKRSLEYEPENKTALSELNFIENKIRGQEDAHAQFQLGFISCKAGRNNVAIDYFKQAIQINPDYHDAHFNLGICYLTLDCTNEAIECFKQAIRINPDDSNAQFILGECYIKLSHNSEAIECFKQAIQINPDDADAHYKLGVCQLKSDRANEAIDCFKQAIRIKPHYPRAHFSLGFCFLTLDRTNEAIECFKQAIQINPDNVMALNSLGDCYLKLGHSNEAIDCHKQAIQINPEDAVAHYKLAVCYDELKRSNEAIEYCKQAIRIKPDHAQAHFLLGFSYLLLWRPGLALDEVKILKDLDPKMANLLLSSPLLKDLIIDR